MNDDIVRQFKYLWVIRIGIVALVIVAAFILILFIFRRRSILRGKGITNTAKDIRKLRSRDRWVVTTNKYIKAIGTILKSTPLKIDNVTRDYLNYNLKRANKRVPGEFRYITADEWVSVNICITLLLCILSTGFIFINKSATIILILLIIAFGNLLPRMILRNTVTIKDVELNSQFPDFYLMIHYVLMTGGNTPLEKIMRSYAKTTDKTEITRFIDISTDYIDTYGEYNAMQYIINDYKEVHNICRLCRLIKQISDKSEVESELKGFRQELLLLKKIEIETKTDKLIAKAKASLLLIMIILLQAIVSAMMIYLPDIFGGVVSFF